MNCFSEEAEGGYVPTELYMEAPLLGRFAEDLLDRDPARRLLLSRSDLGGTNVGNYVLAVDGFTPAGVVDTTELTSVACGSPTPAASLSR